MLCFVNTKSGGNQGKLVIQILKKLLNPVQVIDAFTVDTITVLEKFCSLPSLMVLVCGGDGTVGGILDYLAMLPMSFSRPPVAILPLGTGNDLSNILGWGVTADVGDLPKTLEQILRASTCVLDRWEMKIEKEDKKSKRLIEVSKRKFNNYLGVGVDAQIIEKFHNARESRKALFSLQVGNKLWYGLIGKF